MDAIIHCGGGNRFNIERSTERFDENGFIEAFCKGVLKYNVQFITGKQKISYMNEKLEKLFFAK